MTFQPTASQIADALAHAAACAPMESCGVIAGGKFVPVDNLASDQGHFVMDRRRFCRIDAVTRCEAIVHSHVAFPPIAGDADRAGCNASGLPWLIVAWPAGSWCVIAPDGRQAPLVGRQWSWGVHDCYSLVRDAFHAYTGIALPDYQRDWEFWQTEDLISDHIIENGFAVLPAGIAPRQCDLLGMKFSSPVVNHLALFLEPDLILHQLYQRLSLREVYSQPWRQRTVLHLRHRSFL